MKLPPSLFQASVALPRWRLCCVGYANAVILLSTEVTFRRQVGPLVGTVAFSRKCKCLPAYLLESKCVFIRTHDPWRKLYKITPWTRFRICIFLTLGLAIVCLLVADDKQDTVGGDKDGADGADDSVGTQFGGRMLGLTWRWGNGVRVVVFITL